eukprot:TRINITY_DN810_c0_g2_i3.p3 TRINITY_DN810_c0_g2~~TRINITY_DN810_c0_g2_i3.p3  ORF type:complete len:129 (+),score=8.19 TRINITY_DN810_c0_g2_i3:66-452(+)
MCIRDRYKRIKCGDDLRFSDTTTQEFGEMIPSIIETYQSLSELSNRVQFIALTEIVTKLLIDQNHLEKSQQDELSKFLANIPKIEKNLVKELADILSDSKQINSNLALERFEGKRWYFSAKIREISLA